MMNTLRTFLRYSYRNSAKQRTLALRTRNVLKRDYLEGTFDNVRRYLRGNESIIAEWHVPSRETCYALSQEALRVSQLVNEAGKEILNGDFNPSTSMVQKFFTLCSFEKALWEAVKEAEEREKADMERRSRESQERYDALMAELEADDDLPF